MYNFSCLTCACAPERGRRKDLASREHLEHGARKEAQHASVRLAHAMPVIVEAQDAAGASVHGERVVVRHARVWVGIEVRVALHPHASSPAVPRRDGTYGGRGASPNAPRER